MSWSAASVFGSASWGSTADFEINSLTGGRQTLQVNGAAGASHSLRVTGATTAGTPTAWIHNSNNTAGADCLVVSSVSENDAEVFAVRTNTTTYGGGDTDFIVKLVSNSPRVGIGIAAPTQHLHVAGNMRLTGGFYDKDNSLGSAGQILTTDGSATYWSAAGSGTISGSGTDNYVPRWNGTTALQNSAIFSSDSGSVGIGTATPGGTLQISDENGGQQMLLVRNYDTSNTGAFTGDYVAEIRSAYATGAHGGALLVHTREGNDARPTMAISDVNGIFTTFVNGKVGIGTTAPYGRLNVHGAMTAIGTGIGNSAVFVSSSDALAADKGGIIQLGGIYTSGGDVTQWAAIGGFKDNATTANYAGYMSFYTRAQGAAPVERMRIDSSGKVGIGTSAPADRLHVKASGSSGKIISDTTGTGGWTGYQLWINGVEKWGASAY